MYIFLNELSLLLGFLSWILGFAALRRRNPKASGLSFLFCAAALFSQILYTQHLVVIRDFSSIADTHRAVTLAASVLLGISFLLNLPALFLKK